MIRLPASVVSTCPRTLPWLVLAWLVSLGGCIDSSAETADDGMDGSVVGDAASGGDAAAISAVRTVPLCADAIAECSVSLFGNSWGVLLEARSFGSAARLVAAGRRAVIVGSDVEAYRIAYLRSAGGSETDEPYMTWELPVPDNQLPIAVTDGQKSVRDGSPIYVLTCDGNRVNCRVWQANDVERNGLAILREIPLPADFVASGIDLDRYPESDSVRDLPCVFGSGMLCLEGDGWVERIASQSDLRLNHVAFDFSWSVAVGDDGRWFLRDRDENLKLNPWQEQPTIGKAKLTHVSTAMAEAVLSGQGRIQALAGLQADRFACFPATNLVAFLLNPEIGGFAFAVTERGQILVHPGEYAPSEQGFCIHRDFMLQDEVIQVGAAPCGGSSNPRLLTSRALYGTNDCLIID